MEVLRNLNVCKNGKASIRTLVCAFYAECGVVTKITAIRILRSKVVKIIAY